MAVVYLDDPIGEEPHAAGLGALLVQRHPPYLDHLLRGALERGAHRGGKRAQQRMGAQQVLALGHSHQRGVPQELLQIRLPWTPARIQQRIHGGSV